MTCVKSDRIGITDGNTQKGYADVEQQMGQNVGGTYHNCQISGEMHPTWSLGRNAQLAEYLGVGWHNVFFIIDLKDSKDEEKFQAWQSYFFVYFLWTASVELVGGVGLIFKHNKVSYLIINGWRIERIGLFFRNHERGFIMRIGSDLFLFLGRSTWERENTK